MYGVATYCFYALSMVSLMVLRRRGIPSEYRGPGLPGGQGLHPILFCIKEFPGSSQSAALLHPRNT